MTTRLHEQPTQTTHMFSDIAVYSRVSRAAGVEDGETYAKTITPDDFPAVSVWSRIHCCRAARSFGISGAGSYLLTKSN
jgi:hypothetical protein